MAVFRGAAPHGRSRPAAQRLAATEEWRPGRRRATRLPTEERATQRRQMVGHGQSARERRHLSRRSLWVSTILRAGELSEALFPAQPLRRLRVSSFSPSTRHAWCLLDGHRNSTMDAVVIIGTLPLCIPDGHGRLPSVGRSEPRDCCGTRTLHARIYFSSYLPTGCGGNARTCLDLGLAALRLRNMKKVWPRTFSRRFSRHSWCG